MDRNETVRILRLAAFGGLTETEVNMVLMEYCIEQGKTLPSLTLEEFRAASPVFEADIMQAVTTRSSAEGRNSVGGSSREAAKAGIASIRKRLKQY